jgi:Arc/MetJ family transcription regulator
VCPGTAQPTLNNSGRREPVADVANQFPALRRDKAQVYRWCMSRTNIDIDDEACRVVMRRYRLATKREAVNFALRTLAAEPLDLDEARGLRGSGWAGDLDEMRAHRTS